MTTKERLNKHDKQIAAIRTLIHEGMRLLVDHMRETRKEIRELTAAQKRTDAALKALIEHRGNGHSKSGGQLK